MSVVSMKQLLEAGVHFGHQTRRWNPKMAPYIYMERNGIYIIDLQKTVRKLENAYNFIREVSETGGQVLFVGTKKQAQDAVREEAERVGMFFVNARWLGGMLTNFKTMRLRIDRLAQLRQMQDDGTFDILPKKEVIKLTNEINRLEKYLGGVKEMKKLPAALFIVDPRKERNAIAEARKLGIPIVAIVDTNCDPDEIDYVIPGNDDAIRAIRLIAQAMANAVVEGRQGLDAAPTEDGEESAPVAGLAAEPEQKSFTPARPVTASPPPAPVKAAPQPKVEEAPKAIVEPKVEEAKAEEVTAEPVVEEPKKRAPRAKKVAEEVTEDAPVDSAAADAEEAPAKKTAKKATKAADEVAEDAPKKRATKKAADKDADVEDELVKKATKKATKKTEEASE